jgi:hypothetical protein
MRSIVFTVWLLAIVSAPALGQTFQLDDGTEFTVVTGQWSQERDGFAGTSSAAPGAWLLSNKSYTDFDLSLEFKAEEGVGAIAVRAHQLPGTPILNDEDTSELPKAMHGYGVAAGGAKSGSLIDLQNRFQHIVDDDLQDAYKKNKWQRLEVAARGESIEVTVNGQPAVSASENYYTAGHIGFFFQGPVDSDANIQFRNIEITDHGRTGNWKPLFNGENFDGWVEWGTETWTANNGIIEGTSGPDKSEGYLATDEEFSDFHVRGKFKILGDGNYGLFYRSTIAYDEKNYPIISGVQTEVAPGTPSPSGWLYESYKRGWLGEKPDMSNPAAYALQEGEWNEIEVKAEGNRVVSWVNGIQVIDFTDDAPNYDKGAFALQLHAGGAEGILWKDLYVKDVE